MSPWTITTYFKRFWETLCSQLILFRSPFKNQKGQAIVEYMLLIVVILSIAYALGRHFFTPLQKFGSSVFTSTIACALEYGQLPAEISSEDGCSTSMQSTAFGGSRGGGSGGSSSNTNNQSSSSSSSSNREKQTNNDKSQSKVSDNSKSNASSNNSENSNSNRGSGSGVTSINSRGGNLKLSKSVGSESRSGKNSEVVTENTNYGRDGGDYRFGGSSIRRRKTLFRSNRGNSYDTMSNLRNKQRQIEGNLKRGVASGVGGEEGKPKRLDVTNKGKIKKTEVIENNWDMSKLIRMALIVILIIGILLFVFMQVSQIRKGAGST